MGNLLFHWKELQILITNILQQVLLSAFAAVGSAVPQGFRFSTEPTPEFYAGVSSSSIQNLDSSHSVDSRRTVRSGSHDGDGFARNSNLHSSGDHFFGGISTRIPDFGKNGYPVIEQPKLDDSSDNFISSSHSTFEKVRNNRPDNVYSSSDGMSPGLLKFRGIHSPNLWLSSDGCKEGEIRHADGSCVSDVISGKVFLFDAPEQPTKPIGPPPYIPPPKVNQIVLFIRLPEQGQGSDPIIVPPPRQDITVFLLKANGQESQPVVEVSLPSLTKPGVYYVDFGDNVTIPSGLYLQTAVSVISRDEDRADSDTGNSNAGNHDFIEKLGITEQRNSGSGSSSERKISFSASDDNYNSNHDDDTFGSRDQSKQRSW